MMAHDELCVWRGRGSLGTKRKESNERSVCVWGALRKEVVRVGASAFEGSNRGE